MDISKIIDKYSKHSSKLVCVNEYDSPVGTVYAAADDDYLYLVTFKDSKLFEKTFQTVSTELNCNFTQTKNKVLQKLEDELKLYFAGTLKKFTVPLKTFGSDFQKEVWKKLLELPYGSMKSYGDLAKDMGRAGSHARAIGAACGANSHLLIIPCHRLVASGSKGGFNSGVDRKEWLLKHEHKHLY